MSVTTFLPLNVGLSGENLVQSIQYIPGNELYIHNIISNEEINLYTVPNNKRLLVDYITMGPSSGDSYRYVTIKNNSGSVVMYLLYNIRLNGCLYGSFSEHFNPFLELPSGYTIFGEVTGVNAAAYIEIHGHLINTYGGL